MDVAFRPLAVEVDGFGGVAPGVFAVSELAEAADEAEDGPVFLPAQIGYGEVFLID